MSGRQATGSGAAGFWAELVNMDAYAARGPIRVRPIQRNLARALDQELFPIRLPRIGDDGYVDAPKTLRRSAYDAAARVADALHKKKDDLTTAEMLAQLERAFGRISTGHASTQVRAGPLGLQLEEAPFRCPRDTWTVVLSKFAYTSAYKAGPESKKGLRDHSQALV